MSTLTLIRHGQATAFAVRTDDLSELGERQAQRLADYWLKRGVTFDEVACGTLTRQRKTEAVIAAAYRAAGQPWPEAEHDPAFNEYDGDGIVNKLAPALALADQGFAGLMESSRAAAGGPERNRYFQRMFEVVVARWMAGELGLPDVESFSDFHARVRGALKSLMGRGGSNRRVALFTSGGPIGVAVQSTLDAPQSSAMLVNWRVRNCSLTEFVFGGDRVSLDGFNLLPHLEDPALQSFR